MEPTVTTQKWRVAVLLGGDSAEREISLQSGQAVARALAEAGHDVTLLDPRDCVPEEVDWLLFDVAFIALHGTFGEDGALQRRLDALGVRYTNSGATASSLAFDKVRAKEQFLAAGLPTPAYRAVPARTSGDRLLSLATEIGYPIAVKPVAQGSSLGVSIVRSPDCLLTAVAAARTFGGGVFFEQGIPGHEWTVPVLDDFVLPPIRIQTPHPFFDFSAKYQDDSTIYDVITDGSDDLAGLVQEISLRACQRLGCRGMSRVDVRVDKAGKPWLLEVNTVPGMTDHSLVPKSAAALGWDMSRLCEELIRSALKPGRLVRA